MEAQKKYLANIRVPIRASCNLLFSFKENAIQLLSGNFCEILINENEEGGRKGQKQLKI